jgi:hypothetical protein
MPGHADPDSFWLLQANILLYSIMHILIQSVHHRFMIPVSSFERAVQFSAMVRIQPSPRLPIVLLVSRISTRLSTLAQTKGWQQHRKPGCALFRSYHACCQNKMPPLMSLVVLANEAWDSTSMRIYIRQPPCHSEGRVRSCATDRHANLSNNSGAIVIPIKLIFPSSLLKGGRGWSHDHGRVGTEGGRGRPVCSSLHELFQIFVILFEPGGGKSMHGIFRSMPCARTKKRSKIEAAKLRREAAEAQ